MSDAIVMVRMLNETDCYLPQPAADLVSDLHLRPVPSSQSALSLRLLQWPLSGIIIATTFEWYVAKLNSKP